MFSLKFDFMELFLKILSGMVNSLDSIQTAASWVGTVCICYFIRFLGLRNFRIFTAVREPYMKVHFIYDRKCHEGSN